MIASILLLPLPLLFVFVLVSIVGNSMKASASVNWPTVSGKVMQSGIARGCGRGGSFTPQVGYVYTVGSIAYRSWRVTFGNTGCGSTLRAHARADAYPVGAVVTVHYNPAQPEEATLVVGQIWRENWFFLALIILFIGAGLWLPWKLARRARAIYIAERQS